MNRKLDKLYEMTISKHWTRSGGDFVAKLCPALVTSWAIACPAPLSRGFSRQEYWNELPFPPPEDLPDPGIEPLSLASPALAAAAKSLQSCPNLCDPIDGSPPGSSIPGILQARTLEWVLGTEPYISIQITPPCLQGISQSSTHLWGKRVCNKVKFLLSFQF